MTDATTADLHSSLNEEREKLQAQLAELGDGDRGQLEFDQNFADSSQVTAERAEVEALATTLRDTLAEVEHALAKFDQGNFGLCEECGNQIAPARLEAKPGARLCITCASRQPHGVPGSSQGG